MDTIWTPDWGPQRAWHRMPSEAPNQNKDKDSLEGFHKRPEGGPGFENGV